MDKRAYPLEVLKQIKVFLDDVKKVIRENQSSVTEIIPVPVKLTPPSILHVKDNAEGSPFYFRINNVEGGPQGIILFQFDKAPGSIKDQSKVSYNVNVSESISHFKQWVELIKEYNNFSFSTDDPFVDQYTEEFFTDFELIDPDADTKAYEPQKQIALFNLLSAYEEALIEHSENKNEILDLIEETKYLKENIQKSTKTVFAKGFAKLLAKTKKVGLDFYYKLILSETKKKLVKYLLDEGQNLIAEFTKWLHHM